MLIRVLPLNWIYNDTEKGTEADLFGFFHENFDQLKSCLLVEIIFAAFWKRQQRVILYYCFLPFCVYFTASQLYYLNFLEENWLDHEPKECRLFFWKLECEVWKAVEQTLRWTSVILTFEQLALEVYQARNQGFLAYWR